MTTTSHPTGKTRIAVLMGGPSSEHDVSLASGLQVLAALDTTRHDVTPVHVTRSGRWRIGMTPDAPSLEADVDGGARRPGGDDGSTGDGVSATRAVELLHGEHGVDAVFIALHGPFGEDGTVQALLGVAGLAFTGSDVLASALAMDKILAKDVYRAHGIPTPEHRVVTRRRLSEATDVGALRAELADAVGLPCFVKPVAAGSSVSTHRVTVASDLAAAIEDALSVDTRVLVEECITGTELTCGVLGGGPFEEAQSLPPTEIVPATGDFFDFRAKYTVGACDEITPARIPPAATEEVQRLAVLAHESLGCEGMSRTDFMLRDGTPFALETNTIPGMTRTSLLPQAAAAAGLGFPQLVERLIRSALLRQRGGPR